MEQFLERLRVNDYSTQQKRSPYRRYFMFLDVIELPGTTKRQKRMYCHENLVITNVQAFFRCVGRSYPLHVIRDMANRLKRSSRTWLSDRKHPRPAS
jgi:hypothetical protein